MAARALPLAKTPPGPFGRPPHQPGPLLATAVCVGPVSGGGAVAGTLHAGTWHSQSASPARQPGTRPGPPAGVQAGRGSLTPVPLGHYLRPSERHPPEEAPEMIAFGFCLLFGWPGAAGFKFPRPSAKGRGGACTVLGLARSPAAGVGAGRHLPCPAGAARGAAGGNFSRWRRRTPIWWSGRGSGSKMPILVPTWYPEISSRGAFCYMGSGVNSAI